MHFSFALREREEKKPKYFAPKQDQRSMKTAVKMFPGFGWIGT